MLDKSEYIVYNTRIFIQNQNGEVLPLAAAPKKIKTPLKRGKI